MKVNPKLMYQLNIEKIEFQASSFNQKQDENESFIMANTKHYIFFWKISDVLKNHLISNKAYKIDENIVQGEFMYN